jgi:hypothetical protein
MCNITQKGEHFELKINNQSFDQLYQQRKTPQRDIAYLKSLEITNPIQETQYKHTVKVDPTHDPRHRTTQVLLEAEGAKPGFQDALNKLKGNRPAMEQQQQKNAAAKPAQQQSGNKNNANSMNLMDYNFDFGAGAGAPTNVTVTPNQMVQGASTLNTLNNNYGGGFGNMNNNQPNNGLGNLDWLSDMNKPTGNQAPNNNVNNFGQFEMRGNQPKLTNQYIQASNYKQDEFSQFNDFSGFGNFGGAPNNQGANNNANFNNFGNFGGNPNQNVGSPNLAQQTISLGFDNKPQIQNNQMQQQQQNNGKREKELQKERERQEKEAQKERERLEKEREKQAKKAAKEKEAKQQQMSSPPQNNNSSPNAGYQNPPQNNPSPQQQTVPTYKKPTLSQLIGIDTSKLAGISGTTKKSRAQEEAAHQNEVENHQDYGNTGNYGGGYDNNNYGNQNYGNNNNNYGYSHNY